MAIISYAQNHEDVLLNRLFPESKSGFYIDVGACFPVWFSVTKLFYDRGWHGINIEPIPSIFETLADDRPRDINLRMGLSNHEGTSTFYECASSAERSTFSQELAEDLRRQGFDMVEHSIPVTTLAKVCEQHAAHAIEFLKIDVENHEREVLEGADWARYRPRVVVVEATRPATDIPNHEQWEHLLLEADYLFAFFDGLNRYYVRAEDRQLIPTLAVPKNFFDNFDSYEHYQRVQELHRILAANHNLMGETQAALDGTSRALEEARNALVETRRAWSDSQIALHETRTQLDATREQLAPFQDLGPLAISMARKLRRLSMFAPRLASIAKRTIRFAHPRAHVPAPDA
jgi:FkbM family methyltransferase